MSSPAGRISPKNLQNLVINRDDALELSMVYGYFQLVHRPSERRRSQLQLVLLDDCCCSGTGWT